MDTSVQLQNFFKSCDPEGTKSVDREAFRDLCSRLNITTEDADVIFEDLDLDNDGRISFTDFSRGFSNFISNTEACELDSLPNVECDISGEISEEATKHHVWTTLTNEAEKVGKNSDEGKLKWLLNELQMSEQKHLVPYLESAVEELMSNLHHLQDEKSRLEDSWRREKLEHEKHLKRMEEELDNQVREAEVKMRLKAQEEVDDERKTLQARVDTELDKLQSHLQLMEKVYSWLRTQPTEQRDVRLDEVKTKLDEAIHDNRQLRMSLLDTQTSIALMRSEFLQLRTMYEEKCREVNSEKERIAEYQLEQDHLSRQLTLMHEANKRLIDHRDVIKGSVEVSSKREQGYASRQKTGSIIGDYLDLGVSHDLLNKYQEEYYDDEEEEEEIPNRRPKSMDCTCVVRKRTKTKERDLTCQSLNQSDSGVSTVRDSGEVDENWDSSPRYTVVQVDDSEREDEDEEDFGNSRVDVAHHRRARMRVPSDPNRSSRSSSMPPPCLLDGSSKNDLSTSEFEIRDMKSCNSQDSLVAGGTLPRRRISDIKKQLGMEDKPANWNKSLSPTSPPPATSPRERHYAPDSPDSFGPVPVPRMTKVNSIYESIDHDHIGLSDSLQSEFNDVAAEESLYEPTGPPEHTFKVIFVGDAGVGKSSFALRISKGVFVRNMSSTLGLDFLMRNLHVDGRNVAVQLWDTAGQERFRSITKTYFRKTDGVMLLYDCTSDHSFLNVRQWVEDIDKSTSKRIPVMIVGNKVDLRDLVMSSGTPCITKDQGERLARDCDATFMEGSAKEGQNVLRSLANLVRSMTAHKDLHLSESAMQISEQKPRKSSCC